MEAGRKRRRLSDNNRTPSEREPLLRDSSNQHESSPGRPYSAVKRNETHAQTEGSLKNHLNAEISTTFAYVPLLICFFVSGLIDSGAYNAYECFVSMMSVTSIAAFLLGALAFSGFHRYFGDRKRWVLALSFAVQTGFIVASALLVHNGHSSDAPEKAGLSASNAAGFPLMDLVPVAFLSFQAAGKVVASRVLQYPGLSVVVLTVLYNDLMSDPALFSAGLLANGTRNRRIGAFAFYFGGAVSGGAMAKRAPGLSGLLWTAAAIKAVLAITWLFWRAASDTLEPDVEG